jgi:hypothetical protein
MKLYRVANLLKKTFCSGVGSVGGVHHRIQNVAKLMNVVKTLSMR